MRKAVFLPPAAVGGTDSDAREERVNGVRSFTTPAKKWVQCRELCLVAAAWLLAARGGEWRRRLKGPNVLLLLLQRTNQLDAVIAQENRILRGPF